MAPVEVISILLIIMTVISYVPQYRRMLSLRSSAGIAVTSSLLFTLVTQVQVVSMHLLFKTWLDVDNGVPISTPPSMRDWLNLAQLLVQWICTLLLFFLVLTLSSAPSILPGQSPSSFGYDLLSKRIAFLLWVLHGIGYLFTLPFPVSNSRNFTWDVGFTIVRGVNDVVVTPMFTFFSMVAIVFQATMTAKGPGALSKTTVGMQSLTFLLLAIAWPFRLVMPPDLWKIGTQPALIAEWYPWVGWACVNNAILAIGQGIILLAAMRSKANVSETQPENSETQPLIRS